MLIRRSNERGVGNYDWLKAKYTFSFSQYYDPRFTGYGDLLVINEDVISPGRGFPTHPHNDMEIITYVIKGAIHHKDSMGREGVVRPGEIQYMSAGTGVAHSEYNYLEDENTRLLQIWIKPDRAGHPPNYGQVSYLDRLEANKPCLMISQDGREGSIKINQDVSLYTVRLEAEKGITHQVNEDRMMWLQIVDGALTINGKELSSGDAIAVKDEQNLNIKASEDTEFLLFDLRKQ
jgi:redox-sensitive bicupin YhaK (pirin superfamily)